MVHSFFHISSEQSMMWYQKYIAGFHFYRNGKYSERMLHSVQDCSFVRKKFCSKTTLSSCSVHPAQNLSTRFSLFMSTFTNMYLALNKVYANTGSKFAYCLRERNEYYLKNWNLVGDQNQICTFACNTGSSLRWQNKINKTITDGGVAPPTLLHKLHFSWP